MTKFPGHACVSNRPQAPIATAVFKSPCPLCVPTTNNVLVLIEVAKNLAINISNLTSLTAGVSCPMQGQ